MERRGFFKTLFLGTGSLVCSDIFSVERLDKLNNGVEDNMPYVRNKINVSFPDSVYVILENGTKVKLPGNNGHYFSGDIEVSMLQSLNGLNIYIYSENRVSWVKVEWNISYSNDVLFLGDHWERGYGDLQWKKNDGRIMPWYFMEYDGHKCAGLGVRTGASAFCSWMIRTDKIILQMDIRNGSRGVDLRGRVLNIATIVAYSAPEGERPFEALKKFCKIMCSSPVLPKNPVYGINDWYFAYGNNSDKLILQMVDLMTDLSTNIDNRPYCVIDAGWGCVAEGWENAGCWSDNFYTSGPNFKDMGKLASDISSKGMKPGLWMRPLCAPVDAKKSILLNSVGRKSKREIIRDPTIHENIVYIDKCFRCYREWGYEFVKHDFTTYDIFGCWGFQMLEYGMCLGDWQFYDKTLTNAEVITNLYKNIRRAAGDIVLLGCNTISHLSAGIFEIQRIGDDTSGSDWSRTLKMGVNSLAFRASHHNNFYAADADCVPLTKNVSWDLTEKWMKLVALSGTPLFISADPDILGEKQKRFIKKCFTYASSRLPLCEPLDWFDTLTPQKWMLNNKEYYFEWT